MLKKWNGKVLFSRLDNIFFRYLIPLRFNTNDINLRSRGATLCSRRGKKFASSRAPTIKFFLCHYCIIPHFLGVTSRNEKALGSFFGGCGWGSGGSSATPPTTSSLLIIIHFCHSDAKRGISCRLPGNYHKKQKRGPRAPLQEKVLLKT